MLGLGLVGECLISHRIEPHYQPTKIEIVYISSKYSFVLGTFYILNSPFDYLYLGKSHRFGAHLGQLVRFLKSTKRPTIVSLKSMIL